MAEACIVMQQVEQVYGKKQVLSDINLALSMAAFMAYWGRQAVEKPHW